MGWFLENFPVSDLITSVGEFNLFEKCYYLLFLNPYKNYENDALCVCMSVMSLSN